MGCGTSQPQQTEPGKGPSMLLNTTSNLRRSSGPSLFTQKIDRWVGETRCDPGFGSDEEENQDVVMLDTIEELGATVAGIFDGHGPSGKQVAEFCRAHICDAIRKHVPKLESEQGHGKCDWLESCFLTLENMVRQELGDGLAESGAAGTVVVYMAERRLLYAANVGDTKAILSTGKRLSDG